MKKLHLLIIIFITLIGIALSAFISYKFYDKDTESILSDFRNDIDIQVSLLDKQISLNLEVLHSVKGLYGGSEKVTYSEFKAVSQSITSRHKEVQALEWIPRVSHSERTKYESEMHTQFPKYQITELEDDSILVKAKDRGEYYPVYYVEPFQGNEQVLGFDLGSSEQRLKALVEAESTGKFVATESLNLVQEIEDQQGFLVFVPIYKLSQNNSKELKGFVLGVFKLATILKDLTNDFQINHINYQLIDITESYEEQIILKYYTEPTSELLQEFSYRKNVMDIAGRQWVISAFPTQEYIDMRRSNYPILIFLLGIFFVLIAAGYTSMMLRRNMIIEGIVEKRTASIRLLRSISELANITKNDSDFLRKSLFIICKYMDWPVGHIYRAQNNKMIPTEIWYIAQEGHFSKFKDITMNTEFENGEGFPGKVAKDSAVHWIADVTRDPDYYRIKLEKSIGVKAALGIPIIVSDKVRMVMEFYSPEAVSPDENILSTMNNIGTLVGRIAEIQRAKKMVLDQKFALDQHAIVAITDIYGKITYANEKFCEISKYYHEELIGQDHRIINSGYHSKEFIANLWKTISSGQVWKGEICNRAKDRSIYWVDTTIIPFLDEHEKPYQYLSIRADITAQRASECLIKQKSVELEKANEKLKLAKDELEEVSNNQEIEIERKQDELVVANEKLIRQEKLAAMGKLAVSIGDELRTPLDVITNSMHSIKLNLHNYVNAEVTKQINTIEDEVKVANKIINDTLDFAWDKEPKFESANIVSLIDQALQRKSIPPNIKVNYQIKENISLVNVDPLQLCRVIFNLVQNAVQAMPDGGELTIIVDMNLNSYQNYVTIMIKDTGSGICASDANRIYDPLYTTKSKGTGLGLSVCRSIIKSHHGTIQCESKTGQGTIFRITIPMNV